MKFPTGEQVIAYRYCNNRTVHDMTVLCECSYNHIANIELGMREFNRSYLPDVKLAQFVGDTDWISERRKKEKARKALVYTMQAVREEKGLTVKDVAEKVGCGEVSVYRWEWGLLPSAKYFDRVCSVYGFDRETFRGANVLHRSGR